jgi:hypothetical protein
MSVRKVLLLAVASLVLAACVAVVCSQAATRRGPAGGEPAVALSPDGTTVATAGGNSGAIELRDAATGELRATLLGHRSTVTTLAFSPDGKTLASADVPVARAKLWDLATGEELPFKGPPWLDEYDDYIQGLAFSPDGKTLAVASFHAVGLWDVASGKYTAVYGRGGSRPLSLSIRWSLDRLFNDVPSEWVNAVSYTADGKLLAHLTNGETERSQEVPAALVNRAGVLCGLAAGLLFLAGACCVRLPATRGEGRLSAFPRRPAPVPQDDEPGPSLLLLVLCGPVAVLLFMALCVACSSP